MDRGGRVRQVRIPHLWKGAECAARIPPRHRSLLHSCQQQVQVILLQRECVVLYIPVLWIRNRIRYSGPKRLAGSGNNHSGSG